MKSPDYYIGPHAPFIDANDIVFQYHLDYYTGGAVAHILRAGRKPGETRHDALVNALGCIRRQIEYVAWAEANNHNHDRFTLNRQLSVSGTGKLSQIAIRQSFGLTSDMDTAVWELTRRSWSVEALRYVETLLSHAIEACEGADPL